MIANDSDAMDYDDGAAFGSDTLWDTLMEIKTTNTYTKDLPELLKLEYVPVFLYGHEKFKFSGHKMLLGGLPRYGIGYSSNPSFTMGLTTTGYPVVMYESQPDISAHVHGEIFLLPLNTVLILDKSYQNGVFFNRVKRSFIHHPVDQKDKKVKTRRWSMAYIYLGTPTHWLMQRKAGSLIMKNTFISTKGDSRYYQFTLEDDKKTMPF